MQLRYLGYQRKILSREWRFILSGVAYIKLTSGMIFPRVPKFNDFHISEGYLSF